MYTTLPSKLQGINQATAELVTLGSQVLRRLFRTRKTRVAELYSLFTPGNYLVNRQTQQCYYVEEANYAGAMLVSVSGQILYIEWINDCGVVQPEVADHWKPAGYQQRQLHRLSVEINP